MKFIYFPLPAIPATLDDRLRERPIAHHTKRWQKMFDEVVELARMAEDLGFESICFPEHHLSTEGLEMGSMPRDVDNANRRAFEEVFQILKLAWKDEPFRHKGEFYQYPFPYEEGTPWPPRKWTETYGAVGEMKDGRIDKISVVPKPYQKPHPKVFQAFSVSEATIRWTAAENIVPMILMSDPPVFSRLCDAYRESSAKAGRVLEKGKQVGVLRQFYFGDEQQVRKMANEGLVGLLWKQFWGTFGFWEAFREDGEMGRLPPLPESEWTIDRLRKYDYVYAGSDTEVRKGMDRLVDAGNPEYFAWLSDQGMLPLEVVKQQLRRFGEKILPHYQH